MNILKVKKLSKKFTLHTLHDKRITALHAVNFNISEGEIVGLVGESGSGKSTLMKTIYRTYLASGGEIWFQSEKFGLIDMVQASDHQIIALRKEEITYCSQFLQVIPRVTALEVVAERLLMLGQKRENAIVKAKEYLERLGLPSELWDAFPSTFSGGEQQRINVARAIIHPPRLLLIDEPTASLDKDTRKVVIEMIKELKSHGTAILCISHDTFTLDRMTDRTLALHHGQIAEQTVST